MSLISVIVPCYNYGNFLPITLNSIRHQTYQNWECIIVNDGSTDNTEQVAKEFSFQDKRFKYFYQANKGLSAARNTGIKQSKGDYIQFLDADDLIEPKKLEEQILVLKENPTYDIIYSSVRYFRNHIPDERLFSMNRVNKNWMPNVSGNGKKVLKYLLHRNIMAANCPVVKRSVFDKVGFFNENLRFLEDYEFWVRCALSNVYFYYLDKPETLALVRVHGQSITNNTWEMRYTELNLKEQLKAKIEEPELHKINEEQIILVKKTLVSVALYELFKGNVNSFTNKLKIVSEEDSFRAATLKIIKNNYLPNLSVGKLFFYGKKLLLNSK